LGFPHDNLYEAALRVPHHLQILLRAKLFLFNADGRSHRRSRNIDPHNRFGTYLYLKANWVFGVVVKADYNRAGVRFTSLSTVRTYLVDTAQRNHCSRWTQLFRRDPCFDSLVNEPFTIARLSASAGGETISGLFVCARIFWLP
jgi:hypothetical protein